MVSDAVMRELANNDSNRHLSFVISHRLSNASNSANPAATPFLNRSGTS